MDETRFNNIVIQELTYIAEAIESTDNDGILDIEFLDGIISIKLEDGSEYVINKHTPTRKIWLSSPVSGASYYSYNEETQQWQDLKKGGLLLRPLLTTELEQRAGIVVPL